MSSSGSPPSSLTTALTSPASNAFVFEGIGAGVFTIEYQRFLVDKETELKKHSPGIKEKKLKKRIEQSWEKTHPLQYYSTPPPVLEDTKDLSPSIAEDDEKKVAPGEGTQGKHQVWPPGEDGSEASD
ncbi:hypothetical protein JCM10213_005083 [Rhodosporidiobolus nylandii]